MSLHAIPAGLDIEKLQRVVASALNRRADLARGANPTAYPTHLDLSPDLSANEQNTLADIFTVLKGGVNWDASDLTAGIKSDISTLKSFVTDNNIDAYLGLATPTAAQTAAALKLTIPALRANIRVLAAILRQ